MVFLKKLLNLILSLLHLLAIYSIGIRNELLLYYLPLSNTLNTFFSTYKVIFVPGDLQSLL